MMRKLAPLLLVAAWLSLASYCLLAFALGPGGLLASRSTGLEIGALKANLADLQARNLSLSNEVAALKEDPDRARREARSLGYLGRGEYEIVLVGRNREPVSLENPGKVLEAAEPACLPDIDLKALSLLIGLAYLTMGLLRSERGVSRLRREAPRSARRSASGPRPESLAS